MSALSDNVLLKALGKEGEVNVAWDNRSKCYHVRFRLNGRQYDRSTGTTKMAEAKERGREIFAELIRGPKEVTDLESIKSQIRELRELLLTKGSNSDARESLNKRCLKSAGPASEEYFSYMRKRMSEGSLAKTTFERLERRLKSFVQFLGAEKELLTLDGTEAESWDAAQPCDTSGKFTRRRTKKNNLDAIAQFLRWCAKPPRRWCHDDVIAIVAEARPKVRKHGLIEVLELQQSRDLLDRVERLYPEYILFYSIALLSGARANKKDKKDDIDGGEIIRLFEEVKKHGWARCFNGMALVIPTGKVNGEPRQVHTPENLKAYLKTYPTSLEVPQKAWHTRHIAGPLKLPPNGLRHTAASSYIASGGDFGTASLLFQSSERTLRNFYVKIITRSDADGLWQIYPKKVVESTEKPAA